MLIIYQIKINIIQKMLMNIQINNLNNKQHDITKKKIYKNKYFKKKRRLRKCNSIKSQHRHRI